MLKNVFARAGLVAASSVVAVSAQAADLDFTPLTGAISFSSVVVAIMAVAVLLCGVHVAIAGAKFVIRMVKGS